jgi:hypothetical protein
MSPPENSQIEAKKYFELLDPSAASFTFQTFADGKTDPDLVAIFEAPWRATNVSRAARRCAASKMLISRGPALRLPWFLSTSSPWPWSPCKKEHLPR